MTDVKQPELEQAVERLTELASSQSGGSYLLGDKEWHVRVPKSDLRTVLSALEVAQRDVQRAAEIITRLVPLGEITNEDIAWAKAALAESETPGA
jgi:hypothetical protein